MGKDLRAQGPCGLERGASCVGLRCLGLKLRVHWLKSRGFGALVAYDLAFGCGAEDSGFEASSRV